MRNGQKRMRGRGHRKSQNPLTRVYESNGPDVKIRGTANHIAEKYIQLARDAQSSGDPVAAENYYQHAEHYFRLIAAAQEQFRQQNPYYNQQQQQQQQQQQNAGMQPGGDDAYDDDGDDSQPFAGEPSFVQREVQPQPYLPRDAQQPFPPRDQPQPQPRAQQPDTDDVGLPAFITGGNQPQQTAGGNGHDQGERHERYGGGYRRRRRHRGGYRGDRPDYGGNPQGAQGEGSGDQPGD
ncbi:MAG TPA: DUF4167 domain-containing protein [Gammaproteobacteria bacterium]|nr:DUF4167 domain-containing protein [Gammaproteobacteria bacterium]